MLQRDNCFKTHLPPLSNPTRGSSTTEIAELRRGDLFFVRTGS